MSSGSSASSSGSPPDATIAPPRVPRLRASDSSAGLDAARDRANSGAKKAHFKPPGASRAQSSRARLPCAARPADGARSPGASAVSEPAMESSRAAPLSDKSNAASEPERRVSDGPKRERSPLPADVPPTFRFGPEGAEPPASGNTSPLASPSFANAATAAGGGKKRALVEQAPRPVTRELPEALAEWKEYAENELRRLHVFRRQGLLDWPLVKGAINCAVVSCPVASIRSEIRAFRDNGVYGSSMVPYLQLLRSVYDAAQDCAEDAEEAPVEFSESDDSDDSDSDDEDSEDSEDSLDEDSLDEDSLDEDDPSTQSSEEVPPTKRRAFPPNPPRGVAPSNEPEPNARRDLADDRRKPEPRLPSVVVANAEDADDELRPAEKKKHLKGASAPSAYQVEMRAKYKLFSRFLGSYFAKERTESASAASLAAHPDAAAFGDTEVVAFLQMLQRENKVMLHEGTVMII